MGGKKEEVCERDVLARNKSGAACQVAKGAQWDEEMGSNDDGGARAAMWQASGLTTPATYNRVMSLVTEKGEEVWRRSGDHTRTGLLPRGPWPQKGMPSGGLCSAKRPLSSDSPSFMMYRHYSEQALCLYIQYNTTRTWMSSFSVLIIPYRCTVTGRYSRIPPDVCDRAISALDGPWRSREHVVLCRCQTGLQVEFPCRIPWLRETGRPDPTGATQGCRQQL